MQMVLIPLHVPFAWHFRTWEPFRTNPVSQKNRILSGYTVRSPFDDPFKGTNRYPQLTAARKEIKGKQN